MTQIPYDFRVMKYECREADDFYCGEFRPDEAEYIDEDTGEVCCPYCGCTSDVDPQPKEHRARWVTVALYDTYRAYGGPEEGGWYYDAGSPVRGTIRQFEAGDFPQAKLYKEQLLEKYGEMRHLTVRVTAERDAESFPKDRPHYC